MTSTVPTIAALDPLSAPGTTDHERPSSVGKALALLNSFSADCPSMGLSELARRSGVPKATAHRLLGFLVGASLVARTGTSYTPGTRLLELAALTDPSRERLREIALPYLLDLYETTHETVHLAVLHDHEVVYLDCIRGHHAVGPTARAGVRVPAATSALGRAMLAFGDPAPTTGRFAEELRMIREHQVAFDRESAVPGVAGVASPIVTWAGAVVGAVAVSGPVRRFRPTACAGMVRAAAAAIANQVQRVPARRRP